MAELRATPYANPLTGLSNDAIQGLLAFMQDKRRTQQLQGLGNLLESTGIPKTIERAAYAESPRGLLDALTNVNRANVPLLKPETAEAAMTLAPIAAPVNRALMQATKGLPVGASILDVGKSASKSIVREGNPIQSAVVLIGDKIFTGRTHTEAFNRAIYEGVVRKEGGKFIYPKNAEVNSDLFMTKDGQIIDRIQASKMFDIGASETAIKEGLMQNKPARSMTVDSYIEQAEKLKKQKKSAPRQEALDTAQRNAVEYPLAPAGTRYEEFGGQLTYMTPDEYLSRVRPLELDDVSLENIASLKSHVQSGGKLDPLHIYKDGKEDGRHRAYMAKELGIEKIPVALHTETNNLGQNIPMDALSLLAEQQRKQITGLLE
jgi:hypothetical protein